MTTPVFRYDTGKDGQPAAHAIGGVHAVFAKFLTEEASWTDYVDLLLDCVATAAKTAQPQLNTGNAWAATVHDNTVTIEHLHIRGHKPEIVPLDVYVRALNEWRAFLLTS